jgi:carbonic anhydrase
MIKRNYSFNCNSQLTDNPQLAKHSFLLASGAISLGVLTGCSLNTESNPIRSTALTKERRDALTPGDLIRLAKQGNERFRKGEQQPRDFLVEQQNSAQGQHPAAVLLTCIDSRAPAEIVLDLGIGDVFNRRVAGNTNPNKFSYCSFSNGRRLG